LAAAHPSKNIRVGRVGRVGKLETRLFKGENERKSKVIY
jgi:hypothetical protein